MRVLLRRLLGAFSILVFLRISSPTSFLRGSWRVLLRKAHPFLQVRVGGAKQLQVGVHELLDHLLGVVLLLLDLLGELLHLAKPFLGPFRRLQPSSGTICVHCSSFIARLDTFYVPAISTPYKERAHLPS